MNREEAIDRLRRMSKKLFIRIDENDMRAICIAIQALSQEPCDDAISRQAVLDGLKGCMCEDWVKTLFATMVKQLPSVTQKSGKWRRVSIEKYIQHAMAYYECTICGEQTLGEHKYCPNCGAKMESEEE